MLDLAQVRICFLAGTLGQGGAERQLFYVLRALQERKAQVRLLCLTSGEFWEEQLRALGIPIEWVGESPSRLVRLRKIIGIVRRERADIVQSQHFYVNPYAAAAGCVTGSKSIGAVRSDLQSEVHDNDELLRKWGLKLCRMVAANSAPALQKAADFGIPLGRLTLLSNVVDTDEFRPGNQPATEDCFTVAAVARLVASKRHDRLLSVIARFKQMCTVPVKLLIVGDGPCRKDIEKTVDRLKLGSQVQFLGNRTDLPAVYQSASVVAITSDYEGTPNVALEAMACGVPVVSTNVGGVPEIIRHGTNGFLAEREDEAALANHLCELATNNDLRKRMGASGREYVLKTHSLMRLASNLEDLYSTVLAL